MLRCTQWWHVLIRRHVNFRNDTLLPPFFLANDWLPRRAMTRIASSRRPGNQLYYSSRKTDQSTTTERVPSCVESTAQLDSRYVLILCLEAKIQMLRSNFNKKHNHQLTIDHKLQQGYDRN